MAALAAGRPVESSTYYFRGATFFETSDDPLCLAYEIIVVCTGEREPAAREAQIFSSIVNEAPRYLPRCSQALQRDRIVVGLVARTVKQGH